MNFQTYCQNHRRHQVEAIDSTKQSPIGQISLPTGTGKTRVQIDLHVSKMLENLSKNIFGCHVIASHRLLLNRQLLDELVEVTANSNIPFNLFFLGSDRYSASDVHNTYVHLSNENCEVQSGLSGADIKTFFDRTISQQRNLILVSTYHSFDRLSTLPKIIICTYDEAHTTATASENDEFRKNIDKVKAKIEFNYFFTATRRVMDNGGGMNDDVFYGPVLYEKSPRSMIDAGEIVAPKFILQEAIDRGDFTTDVMAIKGIVDGFTYHKRIIKESSANPDAIGAKVIVSTTGNDFMDPIIANADFQAFCKSNGIHVFSFSSENGYFYNFEGHSRLKVMEIMKNLPDNADAILLHIDILAEGIDLPSITGVMLYRNLGKVKLIQTLGRAARLLKSDRDRLYSGQIKVGETSKMTKPFCHIIFPRFYGDEKTVMADIIREVLNEYEVPIETFASSDVYSNDIESNPDRITRKDRSGRRGKVSEIKQLLEDVIVSRFSPDDILNHFA